MKVTIVLSGLLLALIVIANEPTALAAGLAATQQPASSQEPALMVLSGASLLTLASLVRRYVP